MKHRSTPVEAIASALNIRVTHHNARSPFSATVTQSKTAFRVTQNKNEHYYRKRFSLAHEIAHVVLARLAGPHSYKALRTTKGTNYEEEAMCDLFAAALLLPRSYLEPKLVDRTIPYSAREIHDLAKEFMVSKGTLLRRVALLNDWVLLLWDRTKNPLKKDSKEQQRIVQVFPFLSQLSQCFVPLYCTANEARFSPNILEESLLSRLPTARTIAISNLGSLPAGNYFTHCIPFDERPQTLTCDGLVKPRNFFNLATFIEANSNSESNSTQVPSWGGIGRTFS
jgi:hypothetical protein